MTNPQYIRKLTKYTVSRWHLTTGYRPDLNVTRTYCGFDIQDGDSDYHLDRPTATEICRRCLKEEKSS